MNIFECIVLGIVQGIGEFLPISSSAHLILVPYLFSFHEIDNKLAFDVALHFGTLLAVIVVFFKEWLNLASGVINKVFKKENSFNNRIFWYLVLATIPGAVIGKLFEDKIENVVRNNYFVIALCLAIMGLLIYLGDKWASKHYKKEINFNELTLKQTFIIGLSQALAVIPGFSRSGTTILTGRLLGLSRETATKFTFLLSAPIILGATILNISDLVLSLVVIIGIITSFIVGLLSIKFLLKYVKKHDFSFFAIYRVIVALIVIVKIIID